MTDEELKNLVAKLAVAQDELIKTQKETSLQIEATDRQIEATDRQIKETGIQMKETDRRLNKLEEKIGKLSEITGGISNNNGDMAEEFFYNGLRSKMELNGIRFEYAGKNINRDRRGLHDEFDIVLVNSDTAVVIEVKYKVHPKDVEKVIKSKAPHFRELFKEYSNYKLYMGIAGMAIPEDVKNMAIEQGLYVLTQSGDNILVLNDKVTVF